ncbi:hypothetical protein [Pseudomonas sp. EL_65y_Pfl1_R83]|uniref:hypothetical protein n=1 Tax=Pseudomonas sp. EL_65y_Pfl1_R83 TaxID=3088697 RepID=UPI0030DAF6A9
MTLRQGFLMASPILDNKQFEQSKSQQNWPKKAGLLLERKSENRQKVGEQMGDQSAFQNT